jgi:hypothetical protein
MRITDWCGDVLFAPPTFIESLTGAMFTLIGLMGLFLVIAGAARIFIALWDWREARRPRRFVRRIL